jgi:hypothetical protein
MSEFCRRRFHSLRAHNPKVPESNESKIQIFNAPGYYYSIHWTRHDDSAGRGSGCCPSSIAFAIYISTSDYGGVFTSRSHRAMMPKSALDVVDSSLLKHVRGSQQCVEPTSLGDWFCAKRFNGLCQVLSQIPQRLVTDVSLSCEAIKGQRI